MHASNYPIHIAPFLLVCGLQLDVRHDVLFFGQAWLPESSCCKDLCPQEDMCHRDLHPSVFRGLCKYLNLSSWTKSYPSSPNFISHPTPPVFPSGQMPGFLPWVPCSRSDTPSVRSGSWVFLNGVPPQHGRLSALPQWMPLSWPHGVWWPHLRGDTVGCQVSQTCVFFSHMLWISHVNINSNHGSSWQGAFLKFYFSC